MRFLLFTALACLISFNVLGQADKKDTLIDLKTYTVLYSQKYLQPLEVRYHVMCPCSKKKIKECKKMDFKTAIGDSLKIRTTENKHYAKSKLDSLDIWDKGHMAPRASLACTCEDVEITYTFINCAIQHKKLNRENPWRKLEKIEIDSAKNNNVEIIIKVEFKDSLNYLGDALIPSGFNKTLIINGDSTSYYFPNEKPCSKDLDHYKID